MFQVFTKLVSFLGVFGIKDSDLNIDWDKIQDTRKQKREPKKIKVYLEFPPSKLKELNPYLKKIKNKKYVYFEQR